MDALYREIVILMLETECCAGKIFSQFSVTASHARIQHLVQAPDVEYIIMLKNISYKLLSHMLVRLKDIAFLMSLEQHTSLGATLIFQQHHPVSDYGFRQVCLEYEAQTIRLEEYVDHYSNASTDEKYVFTILSRLQKIARDSVDAIGKSHHSVMSELSDATHEFCKAASPVLIDFLSAGWDQLDKLWYGLKRFEILLSYRMDIGAKQEEFLALSRQLSINFYKEEAVKPSPESIGSDNSSVRQASLEDRAATLPSNTGKLRRLLPRQNV